MPVRSRPVNSTTPHRIARTRGAKRMERESSRVPDRACRSRQGPRLCVLAGTAVCHVLGLVFVYRAFEIGTLSIVSPISSAFAIVTAVLSFATGERPPLLALAGAALLVAGVALATRAPGAGRRASWIGV